MRSCFTFDFTSEAWFLLFLLWFLFYCHHHCYYYSHSMWCVCVCVRDWLRYLCFFLLSFTTQRALCGGYLFVAIIVRQYYRRSRILYKERKIFFFVVVVVCVCVLIPDVFPSCFFLPFLPPPLFRTQRWVLFFNHPLFLFVSISCFFCSFFFSFTLFAVCVIVVSRCLQELKSLKKKVLLFFLLFVLIGNAIAVRA